MHVVVPYVLVAGRLVVLAYRGSVAAVGMPDGDRDLACQVVDCVPVAGRQVVQILVVSVRHDEHVTVVSRPPSRRDERGDQLVAPHDVALRPPFVFAARRQSAKWAHIVVRLVVEHDTPRGSPRIGGGAPTVPSEPGTGGTGCVQVAGDRAVPSPATAVRVPLKAVSILDGGVLTGRRLVRARQ